MSVQSEITRLNNAKNSISSAITGKGVTVPSGTKLDGMAALIGGIPVGEEVTSETNAYTSKLATLDAAITALETELEGKTAGGGGGGSVGTCTVRISSDIPESVVVLGGYVTVTQYIDGDFVASAYRWFTNTPVVIENVVCGSTISIREIIQGGGGNTVLSDQMEYIIDVADNPMSEMYTLVAVSAPKEPNSVGEIFIT